MEGQTRGIDGWIAIYMNRQMNENMVSWEDEGQRERQSYIQFGFMNKYGIIEDLLGVRQ